MGIKINQVSNPVSVFLEPAHADSTRQPHPHRSTRFGRRTPLRPERYPKRPRRAQKRCPPLQVDPG
jgi:hypothetical protein